MPLSNACSVACERMELEWREDRGGARWVGSRDGVEVAWLFAQPGRWPWAAQAKAGWLVECGSLERAKELMDGHACESLPPSERRWNSERERRTRVDNEPIAVPPHPGTVPAHKRR